MATSSCQLPESDNAALAVDAVQLCAPLLDAAGLKIKNCIACGIEGCVFELTKGKIAKVTVTEDEPKFAALLLGMGNDIHPTLPKIFGVWELPESCNYAYMIVREDLDDVKLANPEEFAYSIGNIAGLSALVVTGAKPLSALYSVVEYLRKNSIDIRDRPLFDEMVDLYMWLIDHNMQLKDVYEDNLGRRSNGQIVVRDLGYGGSRQSFNWREFVTPIGK